MIIVCVWGGAICKYVTGVLPRFEEPWGFLQSDCRTSRGWETVKVPAMTKAESVSLVMVGTFTVFDTVGLPSLSSTRLENNLVNLIVGNGLQFFYYRINLLEIN